MKLTSAAVAAVIARRSTAAGPGRPRIRRRTIALGAAVAIMLGAPTGSIAASMDTSGFSHFRELSPLRDSRAWILQGTRLPNGGCNYQYTSREMVIPQDGWMVRSIALDPKGCRKLMEDGAPSKLSEDQGVAEIQKTVEKLENVGSSSADSLAVTSTTGAWQKVLWKDLPGIIVNGTRTQIYWSYNGSTASGGRTSGAWYYNTGSGWGVLSSGGYDEYLNGNQFYRGTITATFRNYLFCQPQIVYTYHYYNRVWGAYNGNATVAASTDSVNECLPLHYEKLSGYGTAP